MKKPNDNHKLGLPDGVSHEKSPLLDFSMHPRLQMLPDMIRLVIVYHLIRTYLEIESPEKSVSVLDAGCGYGEIYNLLMKNYRGKGTKISYTGVDVDPKKLERARSLFPNGQFVEANFEAKDWEMEEGIDRGYDAIVSTEVLEHLRKKDGIRYLETCQALLCKGGYLFLTSPDPKIKRDNPWHLYEWPHQELTDQLKSQNFKIVDRFFLKSPVRLIESDLKIEGKRNRIPNELFRSVMSVFAGDGSVHVYVLRKK